MKLLPKYLAPARILDAGSGPGVITFQLASRFPDASVIGIDMVEEEIDACRLISESAGITNANFKTVNITELEYKNTFDLITCVDILEHIEDDKAALERLHRALKPQGVLFLHVPSLYRRYPMFKKSLNFDVPNHKRIGYEMEEIIMKAEQSGFSVQNSGFTYGFLESFANNVSYMITRARKQNRGIYAIAFPFLNSIGWLGRKAMPLSLGAGIYLILSKDH